MFKKSQRLSRSEFSQHFKTGKRKHFPHLTIITNKSSQKKVSVVVGKKVDRSAVKRNLLKRRVYALLRTSLEEVESGVFIVILKPSFNKLTKNEAREFLSGAINQVINK